MVLAKGDVVKVKELVLLLLKLMFNYLLLLCLVFGVY